MINYNLLPPAQNYESHQLTLMVLLGRRVRYVGRNSGYPPTDVGGDSGLFV